MTNEQIRMAVAECCGWQWYRIPRALMPESPLRSLFLPDLHEYEGQSKEWKVKADMTERIANMQYMVDEGHLPNYPEDLNAMHEAEKTLRKAPLTFQPGGMGHYLNLLEEIADEPITATARQRCEAFLRTMEKWKE